MARWCESAPGLRTRSSQDQKAVRSELQAAGPDKYSGNHSPNSALVGRQDVAPARNPRQALDWEFGKEPDSGPDPESDPQSGRDTGSALDPEADSHPAPRGLAGESGRFERREAVPPAPTDPAVRA